MKILYVNAIYWGGGAEKIARQLYFSIKDEETQTYFIAGRHQKNVPKFVSVIYNSFLQRAASAVAGIINHNILFVTFRARKQIIKLIKREKVDIVHLHNIHGNYLGLYDLQKIRKYCPNIIITMHDMWLLTGCCPHGMSCMKWQKTKDCHECLGNEYLRKGTKRAAVYLKCKSRNFSNLGYTFVCPSKWLIDCCRQSYLKNEDIRLINNGINTKIFYPCNQSDIRKKHNIPSDKNIIMFSANKINSPYKGFAYLREALMFLKNKEEYCLLLVGKNEANLLLPFDTVVVDYVKDENIMRELYVAADIFVVPSMADTSPLTIMEAMASGTPVVAFKTGGIPEIVSEETGWIVEQGNSKALAEKIECRAESHVFRHHCQCNILKTVILHKLLHFIDRFRILHCPNRNILLDRTFVT